MIRASKYIGDTVKIFDSTSTPGSVSTSFVGYNKTTKEYQGSVSGLPRISRISSIQGISDSVTGVQINTTSGTCILNVDTINRRIGINNTSPQTPLHITGTGSLMTLEGSTANIGIQFTPHTTNGKWHIVAEQSSSRLAFYTGAYGSGTLRGSFTDAGVFNWGGNVSITGTTNSTGTISTSGDITSSGVLTVGLAATTQSTSIRAGLSRSASGYAYLDLIGDNTYTDYGLRIIRGNTGANTTSQILHRGTGALSINAQENASIMIATSNTTRLLIDSSGNLTHGGSLFRSSGNLDVGYGATTGDVSIHLAGTRSGNGYCYIDLVGDATYTDFGLRLLRGNGGANTWSGLYHKGTGALYVTAEDAGTIYFQTANTTRLTIAANGDCVFSNRVKADGQYIALKNVFTSTSYSANVGERIFANTIGGGYTITLPTSPSTGDEIAVIDIGVYFHINNCTVSPNGLKINSSTSSMVLNLQGAQVKFVYTNDANVGWFVVVV
jgi:hypothetical protein